MSYHLSTVVEFEFEKEVEGSDDFAYSKITFCGPLSIILTGNESLSETREGNFWSNSGQYEANFDSVRSDGIHIIDHFNDAQASQSFEGVFEALRINSDNYLELIQHTFGSNVSSIWGFQEFQKTLSVLLQQDTLLIPLDMASEGLSLYVTDSGNLTFMSGVCSTGHVVIHSLS